MNRNDLRDCLCPDARHIPRQQVDPIVDVQINAIVVHAHEYFATDRESALWGAHTQGRPYMPIQAILVQAPNEP